MYPVIIELKNTTVPINTSLFLISKSSKSIIIYKILYIWH